MEINLRHLKQTMGLEVLHCQSLVGVLKELAVFALVYNLGRVVMLAAAKRQGVAVERISCIEAMRWLSTARLGEPFPRWWSIPTARTVSSPARSNVGPNRTHCSRNRGEKPATR